MKKFAVIYLMLLLVFIGSVFGAVPSITNFSSTGGNPTNKDNDQDIMYLVTAGDNLTFTATVDQSVSFEWVVNKSTAVGRVVTMPATTDMFNWTVPNEKGIWEIHLRCWNGANEEVHKEWVVSTLTPAEAPDFFDYFTDGKWKDRTEKDPWNRLLQNWKHYYDGDPRFPNANSEYDASRGFVRRVINENAYKPIQTKMTIPYGTWKFRYRFPDGNIGVDYDFGIEYLWSSSLQRQFSYNKSGDMHHHCYIYLRPECAFSFDYDGTGWPEDGKWHQVTIIRTPDHWVHIWNDYIYEFYVQDKINFIPEKIGINQVRYNGHEIYVDDLEVYREKYLFPPTEVIYRQYTWNYYADNLGGVYYPETREGIVVKGRNMHLADIADRLKDPSKFEYDAITKTAISSADLVIYDGSELIMDNEILKFNNNFDGERHFVLRYGSELKMENSTITTTNNYYFIWNNAGSSTHYGRPIRRERIDPIEFNPAGASNVWPLGNAGVIRFIANNSVINNTAHIFFDSPMELDINNTKFTDLRELDIGDYTGYTRPWEHHQERLFVKGDKSFWVMTDDINTNKFNFNNVSFQGETSPINITFLINAVRDKLNVYNLNLENENIVIKKTLPQVSSQSHTWSRYVTDGYQSPQYGGTGTGTESKLGLVNGKFKNLIVPTDIAWGIPKYYLDVKVVDKDRKPVTGANVTVMNEVDNVNYPSENMEETQPVFYPTNPLPSPNSQYFYLSYQIIQGLTNSSVTTGLDGHTPLPTNKTQTLVVADYVKGQNTQTNFTYSITAEKDGVSGQIKGVDPDESWYRSNPNVPIKTVTVVLGVKTDVRLGQSEGIVVYPNPYIKGKSPTGKITFANLSKEATIRIYRPDGKLVAEIEHRAEVDGGLEEWNISAVNSGIYLYVITSVEGTKKGKVSIIK